MPEQSLSRSSRKWWLVAFVAAVLIALAGYKWNHDRMWTLKGPDGRSLCRVHAGWTEQQVAFHCGPRTGKGDQPKVPSDGFLDIRMCSAPADIYSDKAVLYSCGRKVNAVEVMPAQGVVVSSH